MNEDDLIRHLQHDPYGIEDAAVNYPEMIHDLMRYVNAKHAHQLAVLRVQIREMERARFWWIIFGIAIGTGVSMAAGLFLGR